MSLKSESNINYRNEYVYKYNNPPNQSNFSSHMDNKGSKLPLSSSYKTYSKENLYKIHLNSKEFQNDIDNKQEGNENKGYEKRNNEEYILGRYVEGGEYYSNEKQNYYDETANDIIREDVEYYNDETDKYLNNQTNEYYHDNEKYSNENSNQMTNETNNIFYEQNIENDNNRENKESEYNSKNEEFPNSIKDSKNKKNKQFSKNHILNNLTSSMFNTHNTKEVKRNKLNNKREKRNSKNLKNSVYSKTPREKENSIHEKLTDEKNGKNQKMFSNTHNSSSVCENKKKKRDNSEKKLKNLFYKNSRKGKKNHGKTKELSVYEMKGYIPTSFENNEEKKTENNNKDNKTKNKNKNVYFVDNNANHHAMYDGDQYKQFNYGNNLYNDQMLNIQEQIQEPYNNTINGIRTTNDIHIYPNNNGIFINNDISPTSVSYDPSISCNNVNRDAFFVPQENVYMNESHNVTGIKNVIHKLPYSSPYGIMKTKNEFFKLSVPSSPKKSFFCNSSQKNTLKKKETNDFKTEILIYKNNELNNYNKNLMNSTIYNNDINKHNYFMPTSNNVFVRTRSLTPYSCINKRNNKVSPLKSICINRQKSLPIVKTKTEKPICTHEVSYIYSNPKNVQNINDGINKYGASLPQIYPNSTNLYPYYYKNEENKKKCKYYDSKGYVKKSSNKSSTKCSTGSSSQNSYRCSTLNSDVHFLNEKIKKLHNKINNMNKENSNQNDLLKMYKNECNRLRELFVKNNFAKINSTNIGNVDYEKVNLKLEEENEKLRNQMKTLGKTILSSDDTNGIKKVLAKQIVDLQEENEKYRNKIKLLKKNNDINNEVLFNLNKTDISADAIDSIFMQTKNVIIQGHESINIFYLNLRNLVDKFFEKIKCIIMENDYTKKEKISYINNLEEIIKSNFEEINEIVLKINELRKNMKNVKAHIFDINRGNPYCSCKPSRIILEEDIKHLEKELHKHSILIKNLRKKNLFLSLNNLYFHYNKGNETYDNSKGIYSDIYEKKNKDIIYEKYGTIMNSNSKVDISHLGSSESENKHKNNKKEDNFQKKEDNILHSLDKNSILKLDENYSTMDDKNINEEYHSKLHEKIKIIEEQLNSLNNHINYNYGGDDYEDNKKTMKTKKKDVFLVDKLIKNIKNDNNYFNDIDKTSNYMKKENLKIDNHMEIESSYSENESSHSSSSYSSSSDENENLSLKKKKWISDDEVERSKNKMIELLALLKGKDNDDLVENTKLYINAFGKHKSQNKYNLRKIYDNLNAIKNTIKNNDDDTEKNILSLIESQANEIKIFGNCIDNLKNTVAS
ncbi:conserved Plasmodium protein, unknown function [Plasmodium gallinaceum]|uniref:Uncharacterized protein n=1 Tax=Plasmodium gallinaceum TaxID=5849 RepID=A0A1J1GYD0_PLAGA|nr:conserved Plasmodium protein, unknown function [Plasmodium gallinaceum]CRG97273.1 conserved Plasmodium protein, unknown function [Plasmodium gallinaceum]